jgi:hypothetical protein
VTIPSHSSHRSFSNTTTVDHADRCLAYPTWRRSSRHGPTSLPRLAVDTTKNGQSDALVTLDTKSGGASPRSPEWRGIEGRGSAHIPLFGMSPASFHALLLPTSQPHRPGEEQPDPRTVPPESHCRQQLENDKDTGNECSPTRLSPASNLGWDEVRCLSRSGDVARLS